MREGSERSRQSKDISADSSDRYSFVPSPNPMKDDKGERCD